MHKSNRANVLSVGQLDEVRYPLPPGWTEAAGILKGRNIDALRYQREVRRDWERRLKKLDAQLRGARRVKKANARSRDAR